jgi:hypothetical protein
MMSDDDMRKRRDNRRKRKGNRPADPPPGPRVPDSEWRMYPDGTVETPCMVCGAPLLFRKGDAVHAYVGERGDVDGMLCASCYGAKQEGVQDDQR